MHFVTVMILVSACLAGVNCRWDGKCNKNKKVLKLVMEKQAILVCPEQLGGLPTPRRPAECKGKKVFDIDGNDLTVCFRRGAKEALGIAKMYGCRKAILKSNSPSCGCGKIYDGSFKKVLVCGDGVFSRLLKENKIKVITEKEI